MMTSGLDRKLKVWDLRAYKELHAYKIAAGASRLAFSQRGLLAASINNIVEVCAIQAYGLSNLILGRKTVEVYFTSNFSDTTVIPLYDIAVEH